MTSSQKGHALTTNRSLAQSGTYRLPPLQAERPLLIFLDRALSRPVDAAASQQVLLSSTADITPVVGVHESARFQHGDPFSIRRGRSREVALRRATLEERLDDEAGRGDVPALP